MKNSKSGKEWVEILKNNPAAAAQCEWETLNGHDWELLLEWQPTLIKPEFIKNLKHRLEDFLEAYPEYSEQKE